MKKTVLTLSLAALGYMGAYAAYEEQVKVAKDEIFNGYVVKKIWLENYEIPQVTISGINYKDGVALPVEALPSDPQRFDIVLGKERKRPFALVRVPAFHAEGEKVQQLASFTLQVTEKAVAPTNNAAAKTTADNSPLATGAWYKIAVSQTGLHKIDYNLISKLGAGGSISSANIRVFGDGGNMLPEDNSVARKSNLTENAIWVNDGGDGVFNEGDYVIFYAKGPTGWTADMTNKVFTHTKNLYEDKGYYFLNFDVAASKRVNAVESDANPNVTVTSYNDYALYENDINSPLQYGKTWWGEDFGTQGSKVNNRSFDIDLGSVPGDASFRTVMGCRSAGYSQFTIAHNGQTVGTYSLGPMSTDDYGSPMTTEDAKWNSSGISGNQNIKLTFQPGAGDGTGYLDFIEVNMRKSLAFGGNAITFRDINSVSASNIASYQLANADGNTQVWDVTDPWEPVRINGTLSGSTYSFSRKADVLHEFAAFKSTDLPVPEPAGKVDNQNLHGEELTDYIIVTHPNFLPAAEELANFHRQRSNMKVLVTTPQKIYNEFSSGRQDISGIRDFVRMFYDRAGTDTAQMPKYLLLFGDASYDYKDRVSNNTNFVPTFESAQSLNNLGNYCGDDFFGFLDDNENIEKTGIANTLDVGVGRLPVKSLEEANNFVNKVKHYKSPASLGAWRLSATIIADNEDGAGPHMEDGEIMDATVQTNSNIYNATKVYQDAIPMVSTPGGTRAPEANKMINDQVFKGTLLLNYSGHGNTEVLSHERIITQDDWNSWKNFDKMPFSVTATCDFGQFDQPQYVSAGEQIVLKKDGGVISAVTTVKLVYQSPNRILNKDYLDAQFQHINGKWNTFGDAFRIGKNKTYSKASTAEGDILNFRKFSLFGDPALEPNFPEYFIYTENVIQGATNKQVDTINALGEYIVNGYVGDINGNILSDFNGRADIIIFDKPRTLKTLTNINKTFTVRNNIIYKGKATVTNGKFSVAFIAPKDINYDFGKGKVSYYAENGKTDAAGADFNYTVGGFSDYPVTDNNPPKVRPFIEDSLFRNGGLTGPNTLLYAILEDETGINVSGNAVGHDLTAVLDGKVQEAFILNDYYETEPNTYKRGYVNFPMTGLAEGRHRLVVKAWDVNNNSGEGVVDFEVANGQMMKVQQLMNYPNPFHDVTHFVFEHNHPDEYMWAEINIYNTAGVLMRTIRQNFYPSSSRSKEITWDGTDNNGAKIASGVYIYRMSITTDTGTKDSAYQKLVFIR